MATAQELRRRPGSTSGSSAEENDDGEFESSKYYLGKGLSAPSMLNASPSQSGEVLKLHVPVFYTLLPAFLQRFLSFCFKSFAPSWKSRHLIQLGGYIYRFTSEKSKAPKGSPLPVQEVEVHLLEDLADVQGIDDYHSLAPNRNDLDNEMTYFCIATLRKRHYYAVSTREEAQVWVNTIRLARQEAITRNMGHAKNQPYPYQYFDGLAASLVKSKDRIRRQMHESSLREMELTTVGAGGVSGSGAGPMPRGYFG